MSNSPVVVATKDLTNSMMFGVLPERGDRKIPVKRVFRASFDIYRNDPAVISEGWAIELPGHEPMVLTRHQESFPPSWWRVSNEPALWYDTPAAAIQPHLDALKENHEKKSHELTTLAERYS